MKTRTLALVLLLVATSAVLAAARIGERDGSSQTAPGQSAAPGKGIERRDASGASTTAAALGTNLAEWNRRNPMQGF